MGWGRSAVFFCLCVGRTAVAADSDVCSNLYEAACQPAGKQRDPTSRSAEPGNEQKNADQRVQELFPQVKELVAEKIRQMLPSDRHKEVREKILRRIAQLPPPEKRCETITRDRYGQPRPIFGSFDYEKNLIEYCAPGQNGELSDFQIVHFLAHEVSHPVDPCQIGERVGSDPAIVPYPPWSSSDAGEDAAIRASPFAGLVGCLKKNAQVRGRQRLPAKMQPQEEGGPLCGNAQFGEAFCEWMSAEIVPLFMERKRMRMSEDQYRTGYIGMHRPALDCESDDPKDKDGGEPIIQSVYVDEQAIVNRMFLTQPMIRRQMGCGGTGPGLHCPASEASVGYEPYTGSSTDGRSTPEVLRSDETGERR